MDNQITLKTQTDTLVINGRLAVIFQELCKPEWRDLIEKHGTVQVILNCKGKSVIPKVTVGG